MTAKPVYNPIESVSTLASVIHEIKQAYGKDVERFQPGIISCRSLAIFNPLMDDDFEELRNFLLMGTAFNYSCSKGDYVDRCHFLLNQLRSSIECVVFYPNVCIGRLVRDAA